MSLVDSETGEIVHVLDAAEARTLTDRIKVTIEGAWHLITEAYQARAWVALGYSSWDDYCTREFGTSRLRLPREERQEVVASLRESGLSIRAIAAVTGTAISSVHKELSGVQNRTPEPVDDQEVKSSPKVVGKDGKSYVKNTNSPPSTLQRIAKAREMAAEGYSSRQIGEAIGVKSMADFKARHRIEVPADEIIGKTRKHDPNRIIGETVMAVDSAAFALTVVDIDFEGLDPDRLEEWVTSLSNSLRSLNRLHKQLKEMTQ